MFGRKKLENLDDALMRYAIRQRVRLMRLNALPGGIAIPTATGLVIGAIFLGVPGALIGGVSAGAVTVVTANVTNRLSEKRLAKAEKILFARGFEPQWTSTNGMNTFSYQRKPAPSADAPYVTGIRDLSPGFQNAAKPGPEQPDAPESGNTRSPAQKPPRP